jgi:hypothetical protein
MHSPFPFTMKYLLSIILTVTVGALSYGQPILEIEQNLGKAFDKINYWHDYDYSDTTVSTYDSLTLANTTFQRLLLKVTNNNPEALAYSFKSLVDSGVIISTSEDGLFRIYSWDTRTGGTMRFHKSVFQYKNNNGTFSRASDTNTIVDYENLEGYYRAVNGIEVDGKTYYITQNITIGSSAVFYYNIKIFTVENYGLNDTAKLIKTKSGIRNELGYDIDFSASVNRNNPLDFSVIRTEYDTDTKTISIPLIEESGKITPRKIRYRFDGKYFVKM